MTFVALLIPDWPTGAAANDLLAQLLAVAPRAAVAPAEHIAWLDARGLEPVALVERARGALEEIGVPEMFAGAASVPCVARIAAMRHAAVTVDSARDLGALAEHTVSAARRMAKPWNIPSGTERSYLAALPLDVLQPSPKLMSMFASVGLVSCSDLARLSRESVEVRFGREGLTAWRLARADDPRPIFSSRPRELPTASLDWTEFSTTDLEQLVFVLHSLLKTVCDAIATDGTGARSLTLTLSLENRTTIVQPVGAARATAQRTTWLRLMRRALERITLPDRVTGIAVQVDAVGAPAVRQGDLFDLGFASAQAAESAIAHVMDLQHDAVVVAVRGEHPLMERRVKWVAEEESRESRVASREDVIRASHWDGGTPSSRLATRDSLLALHPMLLPIPRAVDVITTNRRGFATPVRYTDNGVPNPLTESLGPHCISGNRWTEHLAREYHQGVRADGVVVLLYREMSREEASEKTDKWYLAGWWD